MTAVGGTRAMRLGELRGSLLKGRYRVEELIARGGMSRVYGATDLLFGRRCVIKVALGGAYRARIEREAFIGANLWGEGLVKVYDRGLLPEGETSFIALEFLQGETLGQRLARGGLLSWQEAFRIAREATVPLAAAHEVGIVHRDVKPDNLFLCVSGEVRLLDFGIARVAGDPPLTEPGELLGTPRYMAYEQVAMPDAVDGRVDVYALGLSLRAAVAGEVSLPYPDALEPVAFARVLRQQLDVRVLAPWLPRNVARVIERASHMERDLRYPTMREFQRALDVELRRQGGIAELHRPPVSMPRRRLILKGGLAKAMAVGLLLALGVAGLQLARGPNREESAVAGHGGEGTLSRGTAGDGKAGSDRADASVTPSMGPPAGHLPVRRTSQRLGPTSQGQGQGSRVPAVRAQRHGPRAPYNELIGFGGGPS